MFCFEQSRLFQNKSGRYIAVELHSEEQKTNSRQFSVTANPASTSENTDLLSKTQCMRSIVAISAYAAFEKVDLVNGVFIISPDKNQ